MKVLGVDIGGTSVKIGAFNEEGESMETGEFATDSHLGAEKALENIKYQISRFEPFDAIGICSAGQIDPVNGVILSSVNIPGWEHIPIKEMLEEEFHVPVAIQNDVNAAALGENTFGVGQKYADFLFLTYGTGVGGAIVIDSALYGGEQQFAGEFGHTITHAFGRLCNCGMEGCYERYASTTALLEDAQQVNPAFTDGKVLFEYWHQGDEEAKTIVENWVEEISIGLINAVHSFNPGTIIVGGGVMEQTVLIDMIQKRVDKQIMKPFKGVTIVQASLGNTSGMLGGVALHV